MSQEARCERILRRVILDHENRGIDTEEPVRVWLEMMGVMGWDDHETIRIASQAAVGLGYGSLRVLEMVRDMAGERFPG